MKTRSLLAIALLLLACPAFSQTIPDSLKNPLLAPFYYGVMSGDPLADRVILWTHVTTDDPDPISVDWEVATDTLFNDVVQSGTATANAVSRTVKVDVSALEPDQWYYYRFVHNEVPSIIGRTRTMPEGSVDQLRFGVMTCADFKDGYFNAYDRLVERNDLDGVIHLGDYIYESAGDENNVRIPLPHNRCETVEDFRTRYAFYHLDPQLSSAHQQYPWFCIWDDHEFSNDAWRNGSDHFSGQAWLDVRASALQVYHEWMPVRMPDENLPLRIYRNIPLGDLAQLTMLDARVIDRDEELPLDDPNLDDPDRVCLGDVQRDWFLNTLDASNARWRLVAQQILMTPYYLLGQPVPSTEKVWNGFPAERQTILNHFNDNGMDNVVVLTGDVHSSFASDLPLDRNDYDAGTGDGSVAVEFVTPSVTSGGDFDLPQALITLNNPYSKFVNLTERGYTVVDLTNDTAACNFYFTPYEEFSTDEEFAACYFTEHGTKRLQECNGETVRITPTVALAPAPPRMPTAVRDQIPLSNALRCYPNPAQDRLHVEFLLPAGTTDAELRLMDATGKLISSDMAENGLQRKVMDVSNLTAGIYFVSLRSLTVNWSARVLIR